MEHLILGLASIVVLGIAAQWLAWRFKLPAILLLLVAGFLAGPLTGVLRPQAAIGEVLFPFVSAAVAIILFEGGLNLRFSEISGIRAAILRLVCIGSLITWVLSAALANLALDFSMRMALLLGAILIVTGPTVIIPLLRHIRLNRRIASVTKWEGIVNDPIGAVVAVLVFEVIQAPGLQTVTLHAAAGLAKVLVAGAVFAAVGAGVLVMAIQRYWVPDFLQNSVTLAIVLSIYAVSDLIQPESGLVAVTAMGVIMANQRVAPIGHIVEFKENLRVLLISVLFVVLSARLDLDTLAKLSMGSVVFVVGLIVVVRPAAVFLSTIGAGLTVREKVFLSCMAPRGIVAAAVASLFALQLGEAGIPRADLLEAEVFFVVAATVAIYGLGAKPLARWLGLRRADPQGVLVAGAHSWARSIARMLGEHGFEVQLVDSNYDNVRCARREGLTIHHGSIVSERVRRELELEGIGKLLGLTSTDEVNALAGMHFTDLFGRACIYQLRPAAVGEEVDGESLERELRARIVFREPISYVALDERFAAGQHLHATELTDTYDYDDFWSEHKNALAMFLVRGKSLTILSSDEAHTPRPGDVLINLR